MGYYIRVLGTSSDHISVEAIQLAAKPAIVRVEKTVGDDWCVLTLTHDTGEEIAII